jgi:transcriptional regulator with XRE-family HTH domain
VSILFEKEVMENLATFQERLIGLRIEKGLLQKDCAKGCGMSVRGYQFYESGDREPSATSLVSISRFFNVSVDYLLGRSEVREIR